MGERATEPSAPQARRRRAAERHRPAREDLQSLLGQAVERLAASTRSPRVAAWGRGPDDTPIVLAARIEGPVLHAPTRDAYEAGVCLARPQDLGAPGLPQALAEVATSEGFSAVAPIRLAPIRLAPIRLAPIRLHEGALDRVGLDGGGGEGLALLLLGGPSDAPGRVRPRTLAALGAAAERLAAPLAAARAAERLTQVDQEIRRLDRLAALGSLVAEIVHEIRNPLVSVKTFLQLLPERESDPEFTKSFLEVAREELQRIERLLDVVLQHGRPGQAERSEAHANFDAALDSVLQLVRFRANEREVELLTEVEAALPKARLSADSLRQVLLNLALNAIEASPPHGTVTVRAALRDGWIEVCVDDQGPGIPPERRAQIFAPFFSTKSERPGGLGLSISARIIEEARGTLTVEDTPSGGARFRFSLPTRS